MNMRESGGPPIDKVASDGSMAELHHLLGLAKRMGNDDHESRTIAQYIEEVCDGNMRLEDAIVKARTLIDSKNEI